MLTAFGGGVLHGRGCLTWVPGKPAFTSRVWPFLRFMGLFPKTLTLLGEARFIASRLRRLFLGKSRRSPRYFWSRWVYLVYSPVPGLTLKMFWAILDRLVGRATNTLNTLNAIGDGILLDRGCRTWEPGKPSIHVTRPSLFKPQEAVPLGSNSPWRG